MYNEQRVIENYFNLIRINSVTGNEKDIAAYIAGKLGKMGLEVKYSYYDENIKESPSIYAELKGSKPGPTILLIGHMDTVAVANGWKTNPFEPTVEGDKVFGLGSMDMKGGISCILETLAVLIEEETELKGNIIAAFVADEEALSRGVYKLIQDGLKADMAIMAECRFDNAAIGFRGRYSIEVLVHGENGHTCRYPEDGENALINASRLAIGIEKLPTKVHPDVGKGAWCVRYINGGVKTTLNVPDRCLMLVDRYVIPGEDFDFCRTQILEEAKKIGLEHKVEVNLAPRPLPYMEAFAVSKNHRIVDVVSRKYKEIVGEEIKLSYDKSVCDSNFLVSLANIPTITFGPSGENMHKANECGYLSQIKKTVQIYIETIKEIL